jgi:hypothetical protein
MSEDDDDFNSSDESDNDENRNKHAKVTEKASSIKTGILTLEDNEDDSVDFQRPDLTDVYEDNGEDDEDELAGEDETIDLDDITSKKTKKTSKNNDFARGTDEFKLKKKKKKYVYL